MNTDDKSHASAIAIRSLFLTSEERYDVFMVNMMEWPHLLSLEKAPPANENGTSSCRQNNGNSDHDNHHQDAVVNHNDDGDDQLSSALIDGSTFRHGVIMAWFQPLRFKIAFWSLYRAAPSFDRNRNCQ
jgi:hypothetical protein